MGDWKTSARAFFRPGEQRRRLMMAVLGVVLNVWLSGFAFTPEILLGGLASGLASTGMHQLFNKFIEKEE